MAVDADLLRSPHPSSGEDVAFDVCRRCVAAALPMRSSFAAVVRRAQDIVDASQGDRLPHAPSE